MLNSVSSLTLVAAPRVAVSNIQNELTKVQYEITSGLVANPVETLGSKIGLDQSLRAQAATLANLQSTNSIVNTQLTSSQDALSNIATDANTFMKTLLTAQGTGSVNTLALQAQSFLSGFANYANTSSGGVFLFGGTNSSLAPMANYSGDPLPGSTVNPQTATADAYQATFGFSQSDPQVNSISASSMQSFLSNEFAGLFEDPPPGATAAQIASSWQTWSQGASTNTTALISPGQSVTTSVSTYADAFRKIANAYTSIADLGINGMNTATQQALITSAMQQISQGISALGDLKTTLGLSQSQITTTNKALQTQAATIKNTVGQLDNADPYETAERLNLLTTQLEAAYNLTSKISKLSLVNYL